jgi:hypothetical protein
LRNFHTQNINTIDYDRVHTVPLKALEFDLSLEKHLNKEKRLSKPLKIDLKGP